MTGRIIRLGILAAVAGCSMAGRSGLPAAPVAGMYGGTLMIESQVLTAELHIVANGSRLEVELATGDGVRATGKGSLRGTALHAGLDYDHGCPGRMVLSGHASADGSTVSGSVQVADCTGRVAGSFEFGRRLAGVR